MELTTTRVFRGQGFRKNAFPNKCHKADARRAFGEYVEKQEGYVLLLERQDQALLVDDEQNVKHIELSWGFVDGGPRIHEKAMRAEEIEVIKVIVSPSQLNDALGKYTIGGLLVGGIGGAIVGGIIDSFRGPRKTDVSIVFEFGRGKFFNDGINFYAVRKSGVLLTEEEFGEILSEFGPMLSRLKVRFPCKVKE